MSKPQLEQLEALLSTVQKNRHQERGAQISADGSGGGAAAMAMGSPAQPPESPSSAMRKPAAPDRRAEPDRRNAGEERRPVAVETPFGEAPAVAARREQPAAPRPQQRPAPAAEEAPAQANPEGMVPRLIEPDPPRQSARPIAQLVSKHVPAVDATFGAMLKRSLSLRPH